MFRSIIQHILPCSNIRCFFPKLRQVCHVNFIFSIHICITKRTQCTCVHKNTSVFSSDEFLFHLFILIYQLNRRSNSIFQHFLHAAHCFLCPGIHPVHIIPSPEIHKLSNTVIYIRIFPCISICKFIRICYAFLQSINIIHIFYLIYPCLIQKFLIYPEHHYIHQKRN